MIKRVAVIGAGGFVGRAMYGALSDIAGDCVALGRGDAVPDGPFDAVVDCNGEGRRFWSNENPFGSFQASVASVAERVTAFDAATYVMISTVDVYGGARASRSENAETAAIDVTNLDVYATHKYLAECLVRRHARRALVLRCGTVIGAGLKKNPIFDMLNGAPLRMSADSSLSLLSLFDLARVVVDLLRTDADGVFNVSGTSSVGIEAASEMIAGHLGVPPSSLPVHDERQSIAYDINVDKLSGLMSMPTSEEALKGYLRDVGKPGGGAGR